MPDDADQPPLGVLIDVSGVLMVGGEALPGAVDAVTATREAGLAIRFVSNTSRETRSALVDRLRSLGFALEEADIFTAPMAARAWLEEAGYRPYLLIHPDLAPDFEGLETDPADAVFVADAADGFTYDAMNRAFRLLMDGAPLLASGLNRYFKDGDSLSIDAGAFVRALEYAAGIEALVMGKPARSFFERAVGDMDLPAGAVLMVGDDVEADVMGALDAGLQAALVRTGKYRVGDEERLAGHARAVVADDLPGLVERLTGA